MAIRVLLAVVLALYPLIVYLGLHAMSVRGLALLLVGVLALRLVRSPLRGDARALRAATVPIAAVGIILALAALFDDGRFFLFVPVMMNLALFVSFARTLVRGPSMVETFARLRHASLPPEAPGYCRRVTAVWCGFFLLNIAVIGRLALRGSVEAWAFYTGIIAYVLMGVLFTTEIAYRAWRFRHYDGAPTDLIFRRLFPPRPVA